MHKKLGIVITDGVGFRNFILTDFLTEAKKEFSETIVYSCIPSAAYDGFINSSKIVELPVYPDKFLTWFFLKSKEIAHLNQYKEGNFGMTDNYISNKKKVNNFRGYAKRFIFFFTKFLNSETWIQRFNSYQQITFKRNSITKFYQKALSEDRPDYLFFTHQRPPYIAPLILAAENLKIPTATFIFSWDNLPSKGRMTGNFDYYFVWSNLMGQELQMYYKRIKENQIKVVGTPQFVPYVLAKYKTAKTEFADKFKLDLRLKTICFSCGDVSTSKNDPLYIETIAKAIEINQITEKVNFLVRTSPAETPERFEYLKEKYPFISWNHPKWELTRENHQEPWSQRVPNLDDVKDLRAILEYCDIFVNMCSTMSLDAICFDKPVINPVFGNKTNGLYDDQRFLNYEHYKRLVDSKAVAIALDQDELISEINNVIEEPSLRQEAQKRLLNMQITLPLENTSNRIINSIKECLPKL